MLNGLSSHKTICHFTVGKMMQRNLSNLQYKVELSDSLNPNHYIGLNFYHKFYKSSFQSFAEYI